MKNSDIRALSDADLVKKISDTKKVLFDLRLKQSTGTLEHPSQIHTARKEIARMLTILNERKLTKNEGAK
jgi:large subunit ribosomal protein L29